MLTLHKLRVFVVVVEKSSFNQAAQALLMAQSVVSQHIHDLESTLHTALFERSARGVRLTPAGEKLYDYAQQILQLVEKAERDILQMEQVPYLTVGATPGISVYLLPMWLQQFQQTHASVKVTLQTALTSEVVRDVLNGRYDLGFLEGELYELDDTQLGKQVLQNVAYSVVFNPQHPWAQQTSLHAQDLNNQPFINRQPSSRTRHWLDGLLLQQGVRLRNIAELDSAGAIKFALSNPACIAILPHYAVERELKRGELYQLHLSNLELTRPLYMVWNKHRDFNAIQRAFITQLERMVGTAY